MNNIEHNYLNLLDRVLIEGRKKQDRTGTGTISVFGAQIIHDMGLGFPLLTTKKMAIKTMMTELKWFLKGDTNIQYLVQNGCNIWNGDAYKAYKTKYGYDDIDAPLSMGEFITKIKTDNQFARKFGELGPIYGKQWRDWRKYKWDKIDMDFHIEYVDQIKNLINELKTNPDSRRLMVLAWNVSEIDDMVLPPCHYGFQVYTRKLNYKERYNLWFKNNYETGMEHNYEIKPNFDDDYYEPTPERSISLMWNQRSADAFLGLPFNIASYGLLLELIAKEVNMVPDILIGNLGDIHIYNNHIEQVKEQLQRSSFPLPTVELSNVDILNGEFDYEVKGYKSHPTIKAPLSN
jgi:thymidylate synthase